MKERERGGREVDEDEEIRERRNENENYLMCFFFLTLFVLTIKKVPFIVRRSWSRSS